MTNLKWILVTRPTSDGQAQINIATMDGNQVAFNLSGDNAADIAVILIEEMHSEKEYGGMVH
jgi:hypothetical protein